MADAEHLKCPNCGTPYEPGSLFCETCGMRLDGGSAAIANDSSPNSPCEPTGRAFAWRVPFDLSAALPKALQVGRRSLVFVRFRASSDIYESVELVLRNGGEELCRRPCCPGRPLTAEHRVALEVRPKFVGTVRVELDVVCSIDTALKEKETYTAELQLKVEESGDAAFNPVFNISQTQTSDRAGDTRGGDINVNLGGLQLRRNEDPARYETDPYAFSTLAAQLRVSPPRLTLEGAEGVLQLVSDHVVTFGRNRDVNTIALRVCGADGKVDVAATKNISRSHFRIECEGRTCRLRDGLIVGDPLRGPTETKPSSFGTRLDGTSLSPCGCVCLSPGREISLNIGREEVELRMRLQLFCDGLRRPNGFLIDREDGARQRVCAVWREIPLEDGSRILWNGSHWSLEGSSGCVPLAIGTSVSVAGKSFTVLPFYQTFV